MSVNLVLLKKNGAHKYFALPGSMAVIGRRSSCDFRIPLASVSRRHCQLSYDKGVLRIRDLGLRNGITVNGKAVDETMVQAGDTIKVGPLRFVTQIDGKPEKINLSEKAAQNTAKLRKSPQGKPAQSAAEMSQQTK